MMEALLVLQIERSCAFFGIKAIQHIVGAWLDLENWHMAVLFILLVSHAPLLLWVSEFTSSSGDTSSTLIIMWTIVWAVRPQNGTTQNFAHYG